MPTVESPPAAAPPQLARTGVLIDAYDKRVESRWGSDDPFYAATVRGGAAAAQSRRGQLDGGWTLRGADGTAAYVLELVDTGELGVEGAWREAGADAAPRGSGFIALIGREPARIVLRFLEPNASAPTVASLNLEADGAWRGELARAGGAPGPVSMTRP